MNCKEAKSKIPLFIHNRLSIPEIIAFLHHIENCKECYDETDIMNMIDVVDAGLHDQSIDKLNNGYDFSDSLKKLIKKRRDRVRLLITLMIVIILLIAGGIFMISTFL